MTKLNDLLVWAHSYHPTVGLFVRKNLLGLRLRHILPFPGFSQKASLAIYVLRVGRLVLVGQCRHLGALLHILRHKMALFDNNCLLAHPVPLLQAIQVILEAGATVEGTLLVLGVLDEVFGEVVVCEGVAIVVLPHLHLTHRKPQALQILRVIEQQQLLLGTGSLIGGRAKLDELGSCFNQITIRRHLPAPNKHGLLPPRQPYLIALLSARKIRSASRSECGRVRRVLVRLLSDSHGETRRRHGTHSLILTSYKITRQIATLLRRRRLAHAGAGCGARGPHQRPQVAEFPLAPSGGTLACSP